MTRMNWFYQIDFTLEYTTIRVCKFSILYSRSIRCHNKTASMHGPMCILLNHYKHFKVLSTSELNFQLNTYMRIRWKWPKWWFADFCTSVLSRFRVIKCDTWLYHSNYFKTKISSIALSNIIPNKKFTQMYSGSTST